MSVILQTQTYASIAAPGMSQPFLHKFSSGTTSTTSCKVEQLCPPTVWLYILYRAVCCE